MIYLKIKTLDPIHMRAGQGNGPFAETLEFVPGTAVRGALASEYRSYSPIDEVEFQRLFLDQRVSYGSLLPTGSADSGIVEGYPTPLTLYTCKAEKGFSGERLAHGAKDLLPDFLLPAEQRQFDTCNEQTCHSALVPLSGFYSGQQPNQCRQIQSKRRIITRNATDTRRETAANAQLFSRQVIEEGQTFAGFIRLASSDDEAVLLKTCVAKGHCLHLGGGRSRGQGRVEILNAEANSRGSNLSSFGRILSLQQRLENFNQLLRAAGIGSEKETWFTLDLFSDCILHDEYLRTSTTLTVRHLTDAIHPEFAKARQEAAFVRTRSISGWNDVQRVPRNTEIAVIMGSVFVFAMPRSVEAVAGYLERLEEISIGDRTQEGFGRVFAVHPLHLQEGTF